MKAINLFLLLALLVLVSCDTASRESDQTETISADSTTALTEIKTIEPTEESIQYFDQAILAYDQGDQATALAHLQSGINVLIEEGKTLEGQSKIKMDTAIADLEAAKLQLQNGQLQGAADLKQIIFTVQTQTPRRLLADAPVEKVGVQE